MGHWTETTVKKKTTCFLKHYEHVFLKKSLPFVNLVFNI